MRTAFEKLPSVRRMEEVLDRAFEHFRASRQEFQDAAEAGRQRAVALEPLAREAVVPPPQRERVARIAGLDIRRFIPRRT